MFINTHYQSSKAINVTKLSKLVERLKPNQRLVFENIPHDDTDRFIKKVTELKSQLPEAKRDQFGYCIDTAHTFGAGWTVERLVTEINNGQCQPLLIHLNGSIRPLNSKQDEHVPISGDQDLVWPKDNNYAELKAFLKATSELPKIIEARSDTDYENDL